MEPPPVRDDSIIRDKMKGLLKFISGIVCGILIMTMAVPAVADTVRQNIPVEINVVKVTSNGQTINEDTLLWNDKTYIPLRATIEAAGCDVYWDEVTSTASVWNSFFFPTTTCVAVNSRMLPENSVVAYRDHDGNYTQFIDVIYLCTLLGIEYSYDDVGGTGALSINPKAAASTPTQAVETVNQANKNSAISRYIAVAESAIRKAEACKNTIDECIARGMGNSSYAETYKTQLGEILNDLNELEAIYKSILSASTNAEIDALAAKLIPYEKKY